jgi:exonuclease III
LQFDSDIIFFSDIRLGQMNNKSATQKLQTTLLKSKLGNHQLYFNSSSNRWGVAILIAKKIKIEILQEYKDQEENIIMFKAKLNGCKLILASIYGPNTTDREFYRNIDNFLTQNSSVPVVLGGDWNTT